MYHWHIVMLGLSHFWCSSLDAHVHSKLWCHLFLFSISDVKKVAENTRHLPMQVVQVPKKWRWLVLSVDQPTILMRAVACYFTLGGCLDGRLLAIAWHHSCVSTRSLQARFCSGCQPGELKRGEKKRKQNVSIWFCPKIIRGAWHLSVEPEYRKLTIH